MKHKLFFIFCAICVSIAASAEDDFSPDEISRFAVHLPDFTNAVHITTNLIFFLSSGRYESYPANQFKADELLIEGVEIFPVSLTNRNMVYYYVLPYSQTYDFHLYDKTGREIEKTNKGLSLSEAPKSMGNSRDRHIYTMGAIRAEFHNLFRADDIFAITNKGTYDMTVAIRICVAMTNGAPDIYAMSSPFRTIQSKRFGIVESEPACVRVVKE